MAVGRTGGQVARAMATVVIAAVFMTTCDTLGLGDGPLEELERNRELWARVGPGEYVFGLERLCFCPEPSRGPVRISVTSGAVVERAYVSTGDPVPVELAELFPEVTGLFSILEDALERDAFRVEVTYDPETGVPIDIWIDYLENAADEELGFRVTEAVHQPS